MPKPALSSACARKKRLSRMAASFKPMVARCMSEVPASRMNRSRKSSRCSRMKNKNSTTRPVVASGAISGFRSAKTASIPRGSGWCTSTGSGFAPAASCGREICFSRSFREAEARFNALEVNEEPPSARTFSPRFVWYFGRSSASWVIWTTMVVLTKDERAASALSTVSNTAGVRHKPKLRNRRMTGERMNASSPAMTSGCRIGEPI